MRKSNLFIGYLILATVPWVAGADPIARQDFDTAVHARPDPEHGRALFETCAACHGSNGAGASDGSVPAIAAQHFRVVVRELIDYRNGGRTNPRMQHFTDAHHLSEVQDIADVAAYVSHLPAARSSDHGSGEYVERGRQLYAHHCNTCHGATAEGDDQKGYPRLAGQHYHYTLDQMQDAIGGRRPNFAPKHVRLLQSVANTDLLGVADYLSRLGP